MICARPSPRQDWRFDQLFSGRVAEIPPAVEEKLAGSRTEMTKLLHLVNQLLQLEKLSAGHVVLERMPFAVSELFDSAKERLSSIIKDGSTISVPAVDAAVMGDENLLVDAFAHLLERAVKVSPAGSDIVVDLLRQSGSIQIRIRDRGPVLSDVQLDSLFDRYKQLNSGNDDRSSTTGVALAIVKAIIEGSWRNNSS